MVGDGRVRAEIKVGSQVRVVQKGHQKSGELTDGVVHRLLTSSPKHTHGIKVLLVSGIIGRVKEIILDET